MNKETLESIKKQAEDYRDDLLLNGHLDEKGAWMLVLTFIDEVVKYEIDKLKDLAITAGIYK